MLIKKNIIKSLRLFSLCTIMNLSVDKEPFSFSFELRSQKIVYFIHKVHEKGYLLFLKKIDG